MSESLNNRFGDASGDGPFELLNGDIRVWLEQEAIHLRASDGKTGDPVELTTDNARTLAMKLIQFADRLEG
ncbi:MAG TPA: hypothetical protein VFW23_14830 [Tepidisphaeraceae bacterium]|nr:hypothetical protein [Tepidisphaeraceae bacterium]